MPNSCPSEERFPLLLLFLEDGQRTTKHNRRILIDKSRYQGITSGASAVLTQWPGHLTTCWLTATLIGLTIILLSMMMFALSVHPGLHLLTARCRSNHLYDKSNNATIHLVHGSRPWIQSQLDTLEQIAQNYPQSKIELIIIQNEIDIIRNKQETVQVPVRYPINTTKANEQTTNKSEDASAPTVTNDKVSAQTDSQASSVTTGKTTTLKKLKRIKRIKRFLINKNVTPMNQIHFFPWDKYQLNINIGTQKLLKMLFHPKIAREIVKKRHIKNNSGHRITTKVPEIRTIQELIKLYPKIHVTNSTYEEFFKHSPLYFHWHRLNEVTRLFAIRVFQMWNFGGITFDLPEFSEPTGTTQFQAKDANIFKYAVVNNSLTPPFNENFSKYKEFITIGLSSFETLPQGLVTVDAEGLHMETKTTCHAFFGEILMGLRNASRKTMPADVIKEALKIFCRQGAVDIDYCQKVNS